MVIVKLTLISKIPGTERDKDNDIDKIYGSTGQFIVFSSSFSLPEFSVRIDNKWTLGRGSVNF